jgi:hypothetical protein
MSVYLKNNAVGLDKEINHLQEWLYDRLLNEFSWTDYECFGRAYLNKNPRVDGDKKNIFEVSVNGKDYAEITMDDRHAVTSFFFKKKQEHTDITKATVVLFFNLNLVKLLGQSGERMDEDALMDILNVLHVNPPSFVVGEIRNGTKDVYGEYNINVQERDNMSDYMVCSYELTVTYLHQSC